MRDSFDTHLRYRKTPFCVGGKSFGNLFCLTVSGNTSRPTVQNFRSEGSFFENHSVTLLELRFSESVSRAIQAFLHIFELDLIASFQIRLIRCLLIFNTQKLRFMALIYGTKARKKRLLENHYWLWRRSRVLYLPVSCSWLKRFRRCFLCTKKASSFCLLEKKMIDFTHCHLTRKTQSEIISMPEFDSLMELRE